MERVILYSTNCPKCEVLNRKLYAKGIPFDEVTDVDLVRSMNFTEAPILEVGGNRMRFPEANRWINEQE